MNVLQDITNFIFLEHEPEKSDIIFIPGSPRPESMELACHIWQKGYAKYLLPSGKYSITKNVFEGVESKADIYCEDYQTEWEFYSDIAKKAGIPSQAVLKEDKATYTMQNAEFSKQVTDRMNMQVHRAIICCKSFHARRCYMYYQMAYPDTEFLMVPVNIDGINKENWYETKEGIRHVLGELKRCGTQFEDLIPRFR